MSYTGFFLDTPYKVVDGNFVYASDLNNPLDAITTGFSNLVDAVQTGATIAAGVDVGTVNAYQISLVAAPASYVDGLMVWFKPGSTNTGAATLNVNSLGAKPVRSSVRSALVGGELLSGFWFQLKYSLSHDAFLMVSYHGGTDISATRTLVGGDGITVTSNDTTVWVEVSDDGITTDKILDDAVTADKIADGAVTQDKISNAPDMVYNDILGGDITKTAATTLSITPCECWDSTGAVLLKTTTTKTITAPTGSAWAANTLYHIFEVRLVSDGSCEFRAYLTEAAAAADVAQVNAYRWIDFWNTNGSTQLVAAKTIAGEKYIDAYNGLTTHSSIASGSYIDITLSVLPVGRFSAWLPSIAAATGNNSTQPRNLSITHDGTQTHCSCYGYGGTVGLAMWMQGSSPTTWVWLPPTGCKVKTDGETWSLGIAGVKLRR